THTNHTNQQHAYTASAVANSLDSKKHVGKPDLKNLAVTITNIFRSQTASFAGNLLIVFPLSYFLTMVLDKGLKYHLVNAQQAFGLLESQHPYHSWALLYAAFTGVFLFLSVIFS